MADPIPEGFRCVRCEGKGVYCVDCGSSDCVCPDGMKGERAVCEHDRGALEPVAKPYFVEVHLMVRVPVVANSKSEAETLGREHVADEIENGMGIEECVEHATVYKVVAEDPQAGCLPWGVPDDDPRRNWTMKQWLEAE